MLISPINETKNKTDKQSINPCAYWHHTNAYLSTLLRFLVIRMRIYLSISSAI